MRERPGDRRGALYRCMVCTVPTYTASTRPAFISLRTAYTARGGVAVVHGHVGVACGCHGKLGHMGACEGCPQQLICLLRGEFEDAVFRGSCAFLERLDQMDIDETIAYLDSIGVTVEKLDGPGHPLYVIDGETGTFLEREVIAYAQSR